jgi:hypothetical protein
MAAGGSWTGAGCCCAWRSAAHPHRRSSRVWGVRERERGGVGAPGGRGFL